MYPWFDVFTSHEGISFWRLFRPSRRQPRHGCNVRIQIVENVFNKMSWRQIQTAIPVFLTLSVDVTHTYIIQQMWRSIWKHKHSVDDKYSALKSFQNELWRHCGNQNLWNFECLDVRKLSCGWLVGEQLFREKSL